MTLDPQLAEITRCLIAFRSIQGEPQLLSLPCWSDGTALWLMPPSSNVVVESLQRTPGCAVWMGEETGLAANSLARVFGAGDLLGLLVHGPMIALAMAAFALRHPREVAPSWATLHLPVSVRLALSALRTVEAPLPRPGIAPALPEIVPADLRRRLSGLREVIVAGESTPGERTAGLRVERATWSAGFVLDGDLPVLPGASIAVAVNAGAIGVALSGELDARGALRPTRASWWNGSRTGTAPLSLPPRGAVTLPD